MNLITSFPQIHFPGGTQYGIIAQELEQVIPDLVHNTIFPAQYDSLGNMTAPDVNYKAVNYVGLIPFLIDAVNDAHSRIDSLNQLLNGSPRPTGINSTQRVTLSDAQAILLHQNDPNPFSESTVIRFSIPESVKLARIIFTNGVGAILKTATIETRGEGNLEVFASDLSSGIYTYSLVCDGKVIDSKKMMKD